MFCSLYDRAEHDKIASAPVKDRLNRPCSSVIEEVFVFLIQTTAPTTGSPEVSETVPETSVLVETEV